MKSSNATPVRTRNASSARSSTPPPAPARPARPARRKDDETVPFDNEPESPVQIAPVSRAVRAVRSQGRDGQNEQVVRDTVTEDSDAARITDGTQVTVELGQTLNMGNFESLRIGVSIRIPAASKQDAYAAGMEAYGEAAALLQQVYDEFTATSGGDATYGE